MGTALGFNYSFFYCFSSMTTVKETSSIVMTLKLEAAKRINASLRIPDLADADPDVPRKFFVENKRFVYGYDAVFEKNGNMEYIDSPCSG